MAYIWNDLWLTRFYENDTFLTDKQKWHLSKNTNFYNQQVFLRNIIARSKFILYSKHILIKMIGNNGQPEIPWKERDNMRVPPDDYAQNIAYLIKEITSNGSVVVCLGLPSGFQKGDPADYYVNRVKTVNNTDEIGIRHLQYSQILEKTCKNLSTPFIHISFPGERDYFFNRPSYDPVHPNAKGLRFMAEKIYNVLYESFIPCGSS